jgi:hypothetical protein
MPVTRRIAAVELSTTVVHVRFETEYPALGSIENKMFVGSGRFIVEENHPIIVEYKISEVGASCEG